ncbi:MAG: TerB N-terminal domain-containing protein [Deferribacteraceae bacterium]|jgi:hypothetical protein|nr:TerB N-terminal domain-containing protein [Deferribacteraceae bacterium]
MPDDIYKDEPIIIPASELSRRAVPSRYREMRRLASRNGFYHDNDARIFYEQAKFMADFEEDDFDYPGTFFRYYPTYQAMNDIQLRGYFSWRTRLRHGELRKTSPCFALVYAYELLHQIGVEDAEAGFHALEDFWKGYRKFDQQMDLFLRIWLKDYVVYYNLNKTLLVGLLDEDLLIDKHAAVLLNYKEHSQEAVFEALNGLSSYKIDESTFFKDYAEDVKAVTCAVFADLASRDGQFAQPAGSMFGRMQSSAYAMFSTAVFHPLRPPEDEGYYRFSDTHSYRYEKGHWSCERFFCYSGQKQPISSLLKTIDFMMRKSYKFKSPLRASKAELPKDTPALIEKKIAELQARKRRAAQPKIEIDVSKLQGIRQAAQETQEKLIVEEEPTITITEQLASDSDITDTVPQSSVQTIEHGLLQHLLYGKPFDLPKGTTIAILVDSINEQLFDNFNDAVLIDNDGKAELVEDYIDELKRLIL